MSSTYTVNEHTFQKANNSLKHFFIGLMKYSNLLRVNWWVFVCVCASVCVCVCVCVLVCVCVCMCVC